MKTTLTVEIEYDPALTDPEGLASAMDRLMETVLSTPDIMGEYGDPLVGEFFVADTAKLQADGAPLVVIEILGGALQEVYSSDPSIRLALVDYDTEGCDPAREEDVFEITDDAGRSRCVSAGHFPVTPVAELVGTDTAKALDKVGIEYQRPAGPHTETIPRWVIFDPDAGTLITTRVHGTYDEAAEDAAQLHDVLVLPLVYQNIHV